MFASGIFYKIRFERLQTFYTRILIWPNIFLLSLSSLMFFLSSETSDRPGFGVSVLLALSVNMVVMTEFIPYTSRSFPRVGDYFLGSIIICSLGVVLVCIIDRLKSSVVEPCTNYASRKSQKNHLDTSVRKPEPFVVFAAFFQRFLSHFDMPLTV